MSGFSLFDVRKLYLDELFYFHGEVFYILEKRGEVEKGTYDKINRNDASLADRDTVKDLRKQLFRVTTGKKP